jgi:hypothetical protein
MEINIISIPEFFNADVCNVPNDTLFAAFVLSIKYFAGSPPSFLQHFKKCDDGLVTSKPTTGLSGSVLGLFLTKSVRIS